MNSKERLDAFIAGSAVDRRPNLTIVGSTVCRMNRIDIPTYCKEWRRMEEAAELAAHEYRLDFIQVASDLVREAEGYGTEVAFPADRLPYAAGYALEDITDVSRLHPLKVQDIPRLSDLVLAAQKAAECADIYPMTLAVGPATVAGNIRGVEDLMMDSLDEPEAVEELLDIVTETSLDFLKCLAETGQKYFYVADPVASLLSPRMYLNLILPRQKKIFDRGRELGLTGRLHMCGNTTHVIEYTSQLGAAIVDIDHMVDYGEALGKAAGHCILNGNIDPVADVFSCDAAHTHDAILALGQKYASGKAMFMPGCELPTTTPTENIIAIADALAEIG